MKVAKLAADIPSIARIPNIPEIPIRIPDTQWKICEKFTKFPAFLNKQFAQIVYTKRLELHLCERRELCFENTLSKIYQKPRLYIHSCEEW